MKLERTPLALLLTALLFGGAVLVYETQISPKQEETKKDSKKLFAFKEEDVQSLNLTTPVQKLSFEKKSPEKTQPNQKQDQKKQDQKSSPVVADAFVWQMTAPSNTTANDAYVSFLLNMMATGNSEQSITAPADKRSEFGFEIPMAIAEVKLKNQQTHRLVLGKPNFDRTAIYAQVDPSTDPKKELAIVLVPIDFENAVNRPLSEWKAEAKKSDKK